MAEALLKLNIQNQWYAQKSNCNSEHMQSVSQITYNHKCYRNYEILNGEIKFIRVPSHVGI